ncbi:hypothetical protein GCM10022245_29210 [Streptomyces mayteni]
MEAVEEPTASKGRRRCGAGRKEPSCGRAGSFERGLAAARQYLAREGHLRVPRGHDEHLVLEDAAGGGDQEQPETIVVRLGAWRSNIRSATGRVALCDAAVVVSPRWASR